MSQPRIVPVAGKKGHCHMMRSSSELLMEILHDAVSVSRMAHCSMMQANASHGSSRACSIITSFTAFSGAHPAHHHLSHPLVFFAATMLNTLSSRKGGKAACPDRVQTDPYMYLFTSSSTLIKPLSIRDCLTSKTKTFTNTVEQTSSISSTYSERTG